MPLCYEDIPRGRFQQQNRYKVTNFKFGRKFGSLIYWTVSFSWNVMASVSEIFQWFIKLGLSRTISNRTDPEDLHAPCSLNLFNVSSFIKDAHQIFCAVFQISPICRNFPLSSIFFSKAVLPEDLLTMYRKDFTKEVLLPRGPPKIKYGKKPGPFRYTNKGIFPRESAEGQAGLDLLSAHKLSLVRPLESKGMPHGAGKPKTPMKEIATDLR